MTGMAGVLPIQPQSPGLAERIWWGSGTRATAGWTAEQGMNLMSSTLLIEDTGVPFDELQVEQIAIFREAWSAAGLGARAARLGEPQRDPDRQRRGPGAIRRPEQRGPRHGRVPRRRRSPASGAATRASRTRSREELARDVAVQAADTLLLTVPNQLGVEYNARMLETIATEIAPAIGWRPASERMGV